MEEKDQPNCSTETTNDRNASSSNHNWREHDGYRRHFLLPKLLMIIFVIGFVFMVGIMVSGHRAFENNFNQDEHFNQSSFSGRFGRQTMMGGGHRFGYRLIGSITALTGGNLTVHSSTGDQIVVISDTTSIYKNGAVAKQTDLKVGDVVVVSGLPNSSGQISAVSIQIQ